MLFSSETLLWTVPLIFSILSFYDSCYLDIRPTKTVLIFLSFFSYFPFLCFLNLLQARFPQLFLPILFNHILNFQESSFFFWVFLFLIVSLFLLHIFSYFTKVIDMGFFSPPCIDFIFCKLHFPIFWVFVCLFCLSFILNFPQISGSPYLSAYI